VLDGSWAAAGWGERWKGSIEVDATERYSQGGRQNISRREQSKAVSR
jgi:hypothetical protein